MVNRVLMVAFHYPPVQVSSGLQRTLAFSKYLRDYDWEPIVLSAHRRAYVKLSDDQIKDIPPSIIVERAFSLDARRHLAIGGKYLDLLALPDRWSSWLLGGVWSGIRIIRKHKPSIIWSTYPIATAHLIGLALHKLTGVPWVADFRDSMTEETYPREGLRRKIYVWIERLAIKNCSRAVFTTPGAVAMYRERYPQQNEDKWMLLPNGFNEEIFSEIEAALKVDETDSTDLMIKNKKATLLVHSGVIYPDERDPEPFFRAIANLKREGVIDDKRLKVLLRATGHDALFQPMLKSLGITDIVSLEQGISYRDALKEMLAADGLIVFQAANCNHQVPAKIYEYFRAQRPVLALTDINGDTAKTLIESGLTDIAPLDNVEAIQQALSTFLSKTEAGVAARANQESVKRFSRQSASGQLAKCFDSVAR